MFIQCSTYLEESMAVTFNDLKSKNKELTDRLWSLRERLQGHAGRLVNEFADSLELPGYFWKDARGEDKRYVDIGVHGAKGLQSVPLAHLELDDNYIMRFVISTVVDDDPHVGGKSLGISVSLWYDSTSLNASIDDDENPLTFRVSENPGGFVKVCAAIKGLLNVSLDKAMPAWKG